MRKSFLIAAAAILVLLAIGLYFQFSYTSSAIFQPKEKIFYIQPINCPEQICNLDSLRTWVKDVGVDLGVYTSTSVATPSAIVFRDSNVFAVNTGTKRAFSNDLCVLLNLSNACKIFESGLQKADAVTLNFFTSLFSITDVRLKVIAINLKQVFNDSVNVIPRFIIVSNLDDPSAVNAAEVQEIGRQLCMLQLQPNNWVQYVACLDNALLSNQWNQETWQACAQTASVDVNALDACIQEKGEQLLRNEQNTVRQLRLTSTPVLFINNDVYTSQFTFDAVKKTICLYFNKKPDVCKLG